MTPMKDLRTVLLLALGLVACPSKSPVETDTETDTDTDADADTDTDTDTDADSDTDTDADTDTDVACVAPLDVGGGYVLCDDRSVNRPTAGSCDPALNEPSACLGTEANLACTTDADCTAGPNGRCGHIDPPIFDPTGPTSCGCSYACATDADCGSNEACLCADLIQDTGIGNEPSRATCKPATCTTDADCPSGECGLASWNDGCSITQGLTCRRPIDECRSDDECQSSSTCGIPQGGAPFQCSQLTCAIGRPLFVDGDLRTAPSVERSDWAARIGVPARSEALADHWAHIGALEHASVGSFAAVALQLLAIGAPFELVAATQQAGADEIVHARLCYGLASAYAGRNVGPGPLPLGGLQIHQQPEQVLTALIEEACVQETLAALQAGEEARRCEVPEVRDVLTQIAADEQRHAELGWRTLAWMLEAFPELRPVAITCLNDALDRAVAELPAPGLHAPADGVLGGRAVAALRRKAIAQVLRPCVDALASGSVVLAA